MSTANKSVFREFGYTFVDQNLSVQEAFALAGMDYRVEEQPLLRVSTDVVEQVNAYLEARRFGFEQDFNFANLEQALTDCIVNGGNIITSHKATYRPDNNHTLGVVGRNYGIVQNETALSFIDYLTEAAGGRQPQIIAGGSFGNGERVFMTCKVADDFCLGDQGDIVEPFIVFTTSHDGGGAVVAMATPVRVICQNTLALALRKTKRSNKLIFKHTKNVNKRLDFTVQENRERAAAVFAMANSFTDEFIQAMGALRTEEVDSAYCRKFVGDLLLTPKQYSIWEKANFNLDNVDKTDIPTRSKNLVLGLMQSIETGIGQQSYRGSKLWLLNGVTTWLQNDKPQSKNATTEDKFISMAEGTSADYTQRAYNLLTV